MDITALSNLIAALRAETQEDSISPDSLGALLQKIVDVIGGAADNFTQQQLIAWQRVVQQCMGVITDIKQGDADRNEINLQANIRNLSLGSELQAFIPIKQATTERAGAMKAQQVTDLNWCRNRLQEIIPQLVTLTEDLTKAQEAADRAERTAIEGWQRMLVLESSQKSMKWQMEDLQKELQTVSSATPIANFITLQAIDGCLYVRGDIQTLTGAGLVPYIFRYSVKQSRTRHNKNEKRQKGAKRKGWHVFYGMGKVRMNDFGLISIQSNRKDGTRNLYYTSPTYLFDTPKKHTGKTGKTFLSVAYGKHNYDVQTKQRKFRFGIAFGIPTTQGREFRMTQLRTNIAEIKVLVYCELGKETPKYFWSR